MMEQTVKNWTGEDIPLLPQKNNVKDIFGTGYNLVNGISYSAGNEKALSPVVPCGLFLRRQECRIF